MASETKTAVAPAGAAQDSGIPSLSGLTVAQAVNRLIELAADMSASDLFFASDADEVTISIRHLGIVRKLGAVPADQGKRFISHVKAAAEMDVSEHRRPLDGRWIYHRNDDRAFDLRISMIPTIEGEDLAIRLLDRTTQLFTLEQIGLESEQRDQLMQMLSSPSGLILFTGPTGSGKSASMYACLTYLNDGEHKINTIEDPIEFVLAGIRQSQVNPVIEVGFKELLRGALRQSADVIMIGEIRDAETAQIAVQAANAGHLVLATVHAPSAPAAVQSMRGLGVHPPFLAGALRGVLSQRLVRTLCPKCKVAFDVADAPHLFDDVKPWLAPGEGKNLYSPRGCDACNGKGYAARTGVFEVMAVTPALRAVIADGSSPGDIRKKALAEGMRQFRQPALLKVARGLTSTEEVFRAVPSEHLLELEE
jgi:type II secretory ATPase GspE/PulE/Tfp pilus assembly ATPase PilB-like protein